MTSLLLPLTLALSQLFDPPLFGVVWRSVLFSALFFMVILAAAMRGEQPALKYPWNRAG